jgi:hypothetical protein
MSQTKQAQLERERRQRAFEHDVERYGLEYTCGACVHYTSDPETGEGDACSLAYVPPVMTAQGKGAHLFDDKGELVFCKYWELA